MDKVQSSLNEYFSGKGIFRGLMAVDFLLYGGGLVFMAVGTFIAFTGNALFATIGWIAFLFSLVLAFGKKDNVGLVIAFSGLGLYYLAQFVWHFVLIFQANATFLVNVFSDLIFLVVAVLLLIACIHKTDYYKVTVQQRMAAQAAYAAQAAAAQAAAYAAAQAAPVIPASTTLCFQCGFPLAPDAVFCPKCGAKQEKPAKKVCPSCNTELAPDAAFCVKCGTKV